MKKRAFFWNMAVIFIAALVLGGCPDPTSPPKPPLPTLTGITVSPPSRSIGVGQTASSPLIASPVPTTVALGEIDWSSEDENKVTVSADGRISGVAVTESPVKVYATSKTKPSVKGYCEVTVTEFGTPPTAITVSPPTKTLQEGDTFILYAVQEPVDAADTIKWSSEDEDYVTVDEDTGEITAVALTGSTPVKVYATSVETPAVSGYCEVTVTAAPLELKLAFIPGPGSVVTPPTLPAKNSDNVYVLGGFDYPDGNFQGGSSGAGLVDTVLVYPNRVLKGDFKFRARVQITGLAPSIGNPTSASKGLIIGAFKGGDEESDVDDFKTGSGGTVATAINLRLNSDLRNLQSRPNDRLAALGVNARVHDKMEEFIYEVIRTDTGIVTNMYISKNGEKLTQYSSASAIPYTNAGGAPDIQAGTPVYAGIALCAVTARISQVELWVDDIDGESIFYSGHSTPAPVAVTDISVTVKGDKGILVAPNNSGTAENPANYYVTQTAAAGSLELEAALTPSYADVGGATFYLSTQEGHTNDATITVNQTTGVVTITGVGKATIEAISKDPIEAKYYLTITVTPDYVPVTAFNIIGGGDSIAVDGRETFRTDIPVTVTNPVIVWTKSSNAVKFWDGEEEADTFTGPIVTVIGKQTAASVTITATATTTDGTTPTVVPATKTIEVTQAVDTIWEWNKGDGFSNGAGTEVNGLTFTKGGGTVGLATATDGTDLIGALKMTGGARWVIGLPETPEWSSGNASGAGVYAKNAELDLSRKYKLTVKYVGSVGTVFSASLNTHAGSNGAGPVIGAGGPLTTTVTVGNGTPTTTNNNWTSATLFNFSPVAQSNGVEVTVEVTVDPANTTLIAAATTAGLSMDDVKYHQFIQFRADSSVTTMYITYIKLEYVD